MTKTTRTICVGRNMDNIETWGKDWFSTPSVRISASNDEGEQMEQEIEICWDEYTSEVEKTIAKHVNTAIIHWDNVQIVKTPGRRK